MADDGPDYGVFAALLTAAVALAWGGFFFVSLHASLPDTALFLEMRGPVQRSVRTLLPQGWQYYTRDPREPIPAAYRLEAGRWEPALTNYGAWSNWWGLRRASRAHSSEIGAIRGDTDSLSWVACDTTPTVCLDTLPSSRRVTNPTRRPALCGTMGLVRQEPVPWAWSDLSTGDVTMSSEVVRLEIACSGESNVRF